MTDMDEQTALLKEHEGFLAKCALFWCAKNSFIEFDDLMQEGRIALLDAAERWDRRVKLLTYAYWPIRRAMRNHVMAFATPVRLNNHVYARVAEMDGAMQRRALDAPLFDGSADTLADRLAKPEPEEELHQMGDLMALVEKAMRKLKPQQQEVLKARFIDGRKLREVAQDYGVSRERIRQIEAKALRLLRGNRILKRA